MSKSIRKKIDKKILNQIDELNELHNQLQNNKIDNTINNTTNITNTSNIEVLKLEKQEENKNMNMNMNMNVNENQNENQNDNQNDNQNVNKRKETLSDKTDDSLMSNVITIKDFKAKEVMHYKKLDKFFSECTKEECQMMVDIINGNHLISLRFLDWFVTRYCYLYKLSMNIENKYIKEKDFNINISYKAQLKSFKKKYFDPFRRKKKFFYVSEKNDLVILTTLGQLNFFRWALSYNIIKYTEENYRTIINKLSHVNSYFKKHVIENTSFSTTDDNSNSKSTSDSVDSKSNLSNEDDKKICIESSKKEKKIKYKNPVVSRNIFLEL